MTRPILPDGADETAPQVAVSHQARIVVGGLGTLKRTLSLIAEQVEQLEKLDLIDASESVRLRDLATQVTDLVTHYREGRFLSNLKSLIDLTRDELREGHRKI
ncbi:MAG: hypothetical protein P8020_05865 [Acidobacteriota bacterium]|jgi:hypothetical protein